MDNIKRDNLFSGMFILSIAVLIARVCAITSASETPESFLDAQAILEGWESNYGGIRSMQVSYTERVLEAKPSATDPNSLDTLLKVQHVERVEEGKRYHIRYSIAEDGFAKPENLMEHAFDGMTTMEYWGMEKSGTVQSGLTGRSVETIDIVKQYMLLNTIRSTKYQEEYPDGIPMFSLQLKFGILNSVVTVRPNLEPVAGQLCHVIEIIEKNERANNEAKIWVAHEKGMLPLKYQRYKDDRIVEEIEVEQIGFARTDSSGIWYPLKAYRTAVIHWKDKGTVKYELTTHAFVPNVKVDENTFRFDFPNGTRVFDMILGLRYTVGVE